MINRDRLTELYKKYNFEIDSSHDNVGVFVYKKSRYFGVDIVPLNSDKDTLQEATKIKQYYSTSGYATEIRSISSHNQIEEELYKSFFSYESTRNRLKNKYKRFVENQTSKLPGDSNKYEYISSPFEILEDDTEHHNILRDVRNIIDKRGPQLVILEAAAGYGKTCTAFEILNELINSSTFQNPIFTELSRNRGAKIFRYVLLDEIDLEYPSLNSELVKYEISTGRIPIIIDGFDELLSNPQFEQIDESEKFEEVESMLDTIGKLLTGKTKIILTTRRTTIFTGSGFQDWLSKWDNNFEITIFSIKEPRIKDWLGQSRYKDVKSNNFPLQYLANPVLLAYLRNIDDNDFQNHLREQDQLVMNYFSFLLEREIERQALPMTATDQYLLFKNVASVLVELDTSVEEKVFFRQIISDENIDLINNTRKAYPPSARPSVEELTNTLSNHALLDRKGRDDDFIGFINDFVFGTFIGELMLETTPSDIESVFSSYMIELGATAFRVRDIEEKSKIWETIKNSNINLGISSLFSLDITLKECLMRDYSEGVFENFSIYSIQFIDYAISNSVFVNTTFRNCYFDCALFDNVSFVKCKFIKCNTRNNLFIDSCDNINVIKCTAIDCDVLSRGITKKDLNEEFDSFEKKILNTLLEIRKESTHQSLLKLMSHFNTKAEKKKVSKKLEQFEEAELLKIIGSNIYIEINKLSWLKDQLK